MALVIDSSHSNMKFSVRHLGISNVSGTFDKVTGTVDFDEAHPEKTVVDVKIDPTSINTRDERRDGHLKSPDFFDVANHPVIGYKSTSVERTGDNTAKLHGDLTLHGVTKPVVLDVEFMGKAKTMQGTWSHGFAATGKINREDWGLTWNAPMEFGGFMVSKDVKLEFDIELAQQPQAA